MVSGTGSGLLKCGTTEIVVFIWKLAQLFLMYQNLLNWLDEVSIKTVQLKMS